MRGAFLLLALVSSSILAAANAPSTAPIVPLLRLSEIVSDAVTDWNADGRVSPSDEFIELVNDGTENVELSGFRILMNDTTPTTLVLEGVLAAGERRAFHDPPGELNNDAHVAILAPDGAVLDEVRFGKWPGNTARWAGGKSSGAANEALRRIGASWVRGHATPNAPNELPFFRHAPPFDWHQGAWWHPGNGTYVVVGNWTDSNRTYGHAVLHVETATHSWSTNASATQTLGTWGAHWNITTPPENFAYAMTLVDASGHGFALANVSIRVDREPPPAPRLRVPDWTNANATSLEVETVEDAGVGGVLYAVEALDEVSRVWNRLNYWSKEPVFPPAAFGTNKSITLRALAQDGYGHVSMGPNQTVRRDGSAPTAVTGLGGAGYREVHLRWDPPTDNDSGIQSLHVRR